MKPSHYPLDEPIAAIATALAPAALGVIRTSGTGSIELVSKIFSRPDRLVRAQGNTLVHGWLVNGEEKIDEVLASVFRAPKSFTGEDSVELSVHGGPAAVLSVFRLLLSAGFREAERGEFTFRAFAHGKTDLARAEAVREIIGAHTDTARAHAVNRLAGGLSGEIAEITALVVRSLAAIEVEIEYPEDEETTAGAFDAQGIQEARDRLARLESSWASEKLLQEGVMIVLAGRTNAGKSSLFNTLLKEDRSIVSDIHGTTRDWIESNADFLGIPVRMYDTAGLRDTGDKIEAEGVQRSRSLLSRCDLVLYVVDGTEGMQEQDRAFLSKNEQNAPPVILVWNKADSEKKAALPDAREIPGVRAIHQTSAKSGAGISGLVRSAVSVITGGHQTTSRHDVSLGTERQKNAVHDALRALDHALEAATAGYPMDAICQDLEDALGFLGQITGEVTSADVLDAVFSGFCVGK